MRTSVALCVLVRLTVPKSVHALCHARDGCCDALDADGADEMRNCGGGTPRSSAVRPGPGALGL